MVLTASFALSPVTGLFCHRRRRDAKHHRQLDASVGASGPHDFSVRKLSAFVNALAASIASCPASVTIRRPCVGQDGGNKQVIWVKRKREYFCGGGWTAQITLIPRKNFSSGRILKTVQAASQRQGGRHRGGLERCRAGRAGYGDTPSTKKSLRVAYFSPTA